MSQKRNSICSGCGYNYLSKSEVNCVHCGTERDEQLREEVLSVFGERPEEHEKCAVCKRWYDDEDESFWNYIAEFHQEWLNLDDVWCKACILKRFRKEYPEYATSGLEPDIFLVWKWALDMGIDLEPRLVDIEWTEAIPMLYRGDQEQLVKWLSSDFSTEDASAWLEWFDNFEDAVAWRDVGFTPENESIGEWIEWGCSPVEASSAMKKGLETVPELRFRELGFSLEDAVFFELQNMTAYDGDVGWNMVEYWVTSGLSPLQIVELRNQVVAQESEFEFVHSTSQTREDFCDWTVEPYEALPLMFEVLRKARLPITAENLRKFWGLTSKEILRLIDAGGDVEHGAQLCRLGIAPSKAALFKKMSALGVPDSVASTLIRRGFLQKYLSLRNGDREFRDVAERLVSLLWVDESMTIEVAYGWLDLRLDRTSVRNWLEKGISGAIALQWARAGFSPVEARNWLDGGIDPKIAIQWHKEGLTVRECKSWIDAGIKSPVIAKRRKDAGIKP
jgi:hypothetical protein